MKRRTTGTLALLLTAVCLLVSACQVPRPTVAFFGNRTDVTVPAAAWCTNPLDAGTCQPGSDSTVPHLALRPGEPLEVSVPAAVAAAPWTVVFSYRDAAGNLQGGRSSLFGAGQQLAYVLRPPADGQLTRVEVQNVTVAQGANGELDFPAFRTWVLLVDPASG